jgi:hypothetical protein
MKVFKTAALTAIFLAGIALAPAAAQSLRLDRTAVAPKERITVTFSGAAGYADNAWIGIIPSHVDHGREAVNDRYDLTYQYLRGKPSGQLAFAAPAKPGAYDFRMHDTDSNGREVAFASFTVTERMEEEAVPSAHLRLDRTLFPPSASASVHFTASAEFPRNAWVGIIPSHVAHGSEAVNDGHDLTYQYLTGRTSGTLTFTVPKTPGEYDFRMHDTDSNGREVAFASFTVTERMEEEAVPSAHLRLDRTLFPPSASASVHFTASAEFPRNAWVGIIPSHVAHGSEAVNDGHDLTYQYLTGRTSGTLTFTVPKTPGEYDFRMHDTDSNGREVASVSFSVALDKNAVGLNLEKSVFSPLEEIRLGFTAPEGLPGDAWVGIIPSRIAHGSESVNDQHDLTYQYLKGRTGGVLIFTAPAAPGSYDFRMHDTDSNGRELTSVSFRVGN